MTGYRDRNAYGKHRIKPDRGVRLPLAMALGSTIFASSFATSFAVAQSAGSSEKENPERLAPLEVGASAIPGADDATQGYNVDSSRGATKTDTPLIETPQAVDVVTRAQVEDQGARTINHALEYTPGVFTGLAGSSSRQTVVSLRGFAGGDVNNTFLDGLKLQSDPGSFSNIQINPFFLERLDVVKGPSSVLYGRAQPGGLVNLVTKKPLSEQQGLVRFYGGSFDTYGAGFDITGPLADKTLGSYRLIGSAEQSDTQYNVVESKRYTIMPEVSLNLTDDTTLLLQAYLQRDPEAGFHGSVPYDLSVGGSRFGRTVDESWVDTSAHYDNYNRDTNLFSYTLTHHASDNVTLRSKARYTDMDLQVKQVYQNGFIADLPPAFRSQLPFDTTALPPSALLRYSLRAKEHLRAFSTDNSAQIDFHTGSIAHQLLMGLDYQQRKNRTRSATSSLATPLTPFNPDYDENAELSDDSLMAANHRELRQVGIYLQDQLQWQRWHLVLGGRQDYLRREYRTGASGTRTERIDQAFSGRAALLYQSRWGLSPYLSYSEAFNPSSYTPAGDNIAAPVDSHQYEMGLKYQPPGFNALFTLALYDLTQKDVQQRQAVSPPQFTSIGDVESIGVELSAKADLTDRLHLSAAYSHGNVEYEDDYVPLGIEAGNTFVRTPDDLASLWLAYDFPRGFRAGVGGRYVGESFANNANTVKVPDHTLADAFVSAQLGQFSQRLKGASIKVNANNLFNKKYVAACFSELNCYYGEPRNITATLDYRF